MGLQKICPDPAPAISGSTSCSFVPREIKEKSDAQRAVGGGLLSSCFWYLALTTHS